MWGVSVDGQQLQQRREAMGLSLDAVAEATGVAVHHLRALELDDRAVLPAGPYAEAYRRAFLRHLQRMERRLDGTVPPRPFGPPPSPALSGLAGTDPDALRSAIALTDALASDPGVEDNVDVRTRPVAPPELPTGPVLDRRLLRVCMGIVALFVGLLLADGIRHVTHHEEGPAELPVEAWPVQITVQARYTTRYRVWADGIEVEERQLAGGRELQYAARERIEVHTLDVDALKIRLGDRPIRPVGRKNHPRTLSFVADNPGR